MNVVLARAKCVCVCVLAWMLAACVASSVSLIQLDNEWTRTYEAKLQAERADADYLTSGSSYDAQLADLSDRAAKAADAAAGSDPQAAIGLYRVAAAAAWKSGTQREDQVPALSDKGLNACEALPKQFASQPRDCEFLRVVSQLALYDKSAREIDILKSRGDELSPPEIERGVRVLETIARLIGNLGAERTAAASLPLPPSFSGYVDANLHTEYCTIHGFAGQLFASGATEAQKTALRNAMRGAEETVMVAGASTDCQ